jgi:dihydroflavonol-4-reductase
MDRRRAFVTGATGFIGRALVSFLIRQGMEVTCLVRDPAKARGLEAEGARLARGDITDRARVAETIGGHHVVFHLASWLEIGLPRAKRPAMRHVNVTGTANVLEEAWRHGVERIVHCSTVGALGSSGPPGHVGAEDHPHDGLFPCHYVRTKYEAIQVARRLIAEGAPIVNVLPQATYGPGSIRIVGNQMWLITQGRMSIAPDVQSVFGYVHVDDVIMGLWLAAERGRIGASYILAGPLISLPRFYQLVAEHAGVAPPRKRVSARILRLLAWANGHLPGATMLTPGPFLNRESVAMITEANWAFSAEKARRELGWEARTLEEGLPETLSWIRNHSEYFNN